MYITYMYDIMDINALIKQLNGNLFNFFLHFFVNEFQK